MFRQYGHVNGRKGRRFIFELVVRSLHESIIVYYKTKHYMTGFVGLHFLLLCEQSAF
jgi:hypothetical protein